MATSYKNGSIVYGSYTLSLPSKSGTLSVGGGSVYTTSGTSPSSATSGQDAVLFFPTTNTINNVQLASGSWAVVYSKNTYPTTSTSQERGGLNHAKYGQTSVNLGQTSGSDWSYYYLELLFAVRIS